MGRNSAPNLKSGGNIYPSRFMKMDTSADNQGLQAGANETVIGISQIGQKSAPGTDGEVTYAAESGDGIEMFGLGDICPLVAGSGGFTRGDRLKSDANGKGVTIASSGAAQSVGAVALESAAENEQGRVQIIIYTVDPASELTLDLADDETFNLGNGDDFQLLWSTGDASNHAAVLAIGDTSQALHVTDVGAKATDWNISGTTHPNVYVHSNTTPATDYLRLGGHTGSAADIDVVGGATLNLEIDGTAEVTMTASGLFVADGNNFLVGGATVQTVSDGDGATNLTPTAQVLGTAKTDASLLIGSFNTTNDATVAPALCFLKSGNGTIGSKTTVASGEVLGEILFFGDDGTDYESAAGAIRCEADTTIGTGDMPGRLVFLTTADSGETLTEACRISSAQNLCVSNGNGLIVGALTQQTVGTIYEAQIQGTAAADSGLLLGAWSTTDTIRPELAFLKSGNATIGSNTTVANGENLGGLVWYGDDGTDYASKAASIECLVNAAVGTGDMAGIFTFNTSSDGGETPVRRMSIAEEGVRLGLAGTTLGKLLFDGNTSGTITVQGAAAAGTWTFTLPPDDGDAGEQLQTNGSGVTTWEAAGSMRAFKHVLGTISDKASDALSRICNREVYAFKYKRPEEADGVRVTTTGDFETEYHGVMADEYPEIMHHKGRIFNPVSAFGEACLAIKALAAEVASLKAKLAGA